MSATAARGKRQPSESAVEIPGLSERVGARGSRALTAKIAKEGRRGTFRLSAFDGTGTPIEFVRAGARGINIILTTYY
jgi:hypothetical protein